MKASTLGSYIGKATDSLNTNAGYSAANYSAAYEKRKSNTKKAEREADSFKLHGDMSKKKAEKRVAGIKAATNKLVKGQVTKEDVDTIINSFNYLSEDQLRVVAHVIDHLLED